MNTRWTFTLSSCQSNERKSPTCGKCLCPPCERTPGAIRIFNCSSDTGELWCLNLTKSFDPYNNQSTSALKRYLMRSRTDKSVCLCVCVWVWMCVWERDKEGKSRRSGGRVFSPIRSFTQPSRGTSRVPHCSPKASTRRHCCCAASALNPPPTPPHRKQGYCPRDVTSETPTPARLLALAPSRPQPIAMTTEKRIEYKWVLKRQGDQRDRGKERWKERDRERRTERQRRKNGQ